MVPISEYQKKYYEGNKEKVKKRVKNYYEKNKKQLKISQKKYYQKNKKRILEHTKRYELKATYNLTFEQLDEILIAQNHKCLICNKSLMETRRCIDHDHKTGKIRGILCIECNSVIGLAHDNIETLKKAIDYLKK